MKLSIVSCMIERMTSSSLEVSLIQTILVHPVVTEDSFMLLTLMANSFGVAHSQTRRMISTQFQGAPSPRI